MSKDDGPEIERLELMTNSHSGHEDGMENRKIQNGMRGEEEVVIEGASRELLYDVSEHPPIHLTLFFGFQVGINADLSHPVLYIKALSEQRHSS